MGICGVSLVCVWLLPRDSASAAEAERLPRTAVGDNLRRQAARDGPGRRMVSGAPGSLSVLGRSTLRDAEPRPRRWCSHRVRYTPPSREVASGVRRGGDARAARRARPREVHQTSQAVRRFPPPDPCVRPSTAWPTVKWSQDRAQIPLRRVHDTSRIRQAGDRALVRPTLGV